MESLFIQIFACVVAFVRRPAGDYAQFRARVTSLIESAQAQAHRSGITDADFQQALFPLVAWIDESVLCSQWPEVNNWRKTPLQRFYFKTARAGTEFYDRLEALSAGEEDIRAIYYIALALGFRGKYSGPNDQPMLERLKQAQVDVLEANRGRALAQNLPIFPDSYPRGIARSPENRVGTRRRLQGVAGFLVGPALAVLGLYITYQLILGRMVYNILHAAGS